MIHIPLRRVVEILLAALFLSGRVDSVQALRRDVPPRPVIKIGLVVSTSGDLRPWGLECRDGVQLAVDQFNKKGGLHGQRVQLLIEDSGSRPEQGKAAAEKLISEGCITILGDIASGISAAMKGATTDAKVPQIVIGATRDDLTDGSRYMFRTCYHDGEQGRAMARFASKVLHFHRIAVITDQMQPYSVSLSHGFEVSFKELGGVVVDEEQYRSGQVQFAELLSKVKARHPQGVFCSGYFTEAGPIMRQAREIGLPKSVKFLGGDGWDSLEILNSGGDAVLGSYFCNHYVNDDPSSRVKTFIRSWKYTHAGSAPTTTMGALGYDSAGLALDALKRAKKSTREALRTAIDSTVNYKGVTGDVTLKHRHGSPNKRVVIVKLQNGYQTFAKAYEYLEPSPPHRQ